MIVKTVIEPAGWVGAAPRWPVWRWPSAASGGRGRHDRGNPTQRAWSRGRSRLRSERVVEPLARPQQSAIRDNKKCARPNAKHVNQDLNAPHQTPCW